VRAFFLAILLVSLSEVAIAQTECSSIPKASDRLACYDKANPPIAVGEPASRWRARMLRMTSTE
jgi:hypothetical protein